MHRSRQHHLSRTSYSTQWSHGSNGWNTTLKKSREIQNSDRIGWQLNRKLSHDVVWLTRVQWIISVTSGRLPLSQTQEKNTLDTEHHPAKREKRGGSDETHKWRGACISRCIFVSWHTVFGRFREALPPHPRHSRGMIRVIRTGLQSNLKMATIRIRIIEPKEWKIWGTKKKEDGVRID